MTNGRQQRPARGSASSKAKARNTRRMPVPNMGMWKPASTPANTVRRNRGNRGPNRGRNFNANQAKNYIEKTKGLQDRDGFVDFTAGQGKHIASIYGGTDFNIQVFPISPSSSSSYPNGWKIAKNFERYRVVELEYTFKTSASTRVSGEIGLAYVPDPTRKMPKSFIEASNIKGAITASIRNNTTTMNLMAHYKIDCNHKYFVADGQGDKTLLQTIPGNFYIFSEGITIDGVTSVAPFPVGRLKARYRFDLYDLAPDKLAEEEFDSVKVANLHEHLVADPTEEDEDNEKLDAVQEVLTGAGAVSLFNVVRGGPHTSDGLSITDGSGSNVRVEEVLDDVPAIESAAETLTGPDAVQPAATLLDRVSAAVGDMQTEIVSSGEATYPN